MKNNRFMIRQQLRSGQALVEYALILVMVAILFGVTLAATGPAIGNVFSNVVYNIIGGQPEDVERLAEGRGRNDAFWATVEWLATNPPQEQAIALNTPLPPPATATEGPSPTPTPITPSPLPSNTPTHTPTATPGDRGLTAPWLDTIDNPEWWRVDSNVWLGSDQFFGQYFANSTLSGSPAHELWHGEIGFPDVSAVNFNWPSGSGPIESGFTTNNYSVRWTRQVGFGWLTPNPQPLQVRFTIDTRGGQSGARVWLYEVGATTPANGCSSVPSGGNPSNSANNVYGDGQSPSGSATDCLVINAWRDNEESLSVVRTLQPQKLYIIQVDFYKRDGNASVRLGLDGITSGNPSDTSLVSGAAPQCSWNRADTQRSNSRVFIWEEARIGEFPQNMLCYLELRGYIDYTLVRNPKLIFWDVWDLSNANTEVFLQVGEYKPNRADIVWQTIPLRRGTTNYAWTRNIIDLAPYVSGFSQKRLALRFAMQDNNGGARRRWYVDDIEIRDFSTKTFGVCTGSQDTCPSFWNLDNAEFVLGNYLQGRDPQFVTTGRWRLSADRAQGVSSFDSGPAIRSNEVGGGNRIHTVEFNGLIDVTGNVPDFDGDDGVAVLSFDQAYTVAKGTQLEIQWTRDVSDTTPDLWQTVEVLVADPGNSGTRTQGGLQRVNVLLDSIPQWNTLPFRLRFAQIVKPDATETGGWWIDNILIHRFDKPRFSDYPFVDSAEGGIANWLAQGQWGITDTTNFTVDICATCGRAFTDSPSGNYLARTNSALILKNPIDLNFDTPENLDPTDTSNVQTAAAVRPMLSFWHWRAIRDNHSFLVEWSNNSGQTWNAIWRYNASAVNSSFLPNSHTQRAWEYVLIDLRDIQANVATNATNPYDDDIIIRFRLDGSNNTNTADGVYIDDIRIQNYSERVHRLWGSDENIAPYGTGDNIRWVDDVDTPYDFWTRWKLGGWYGVDNRQRSGLLSLHDSPPNASGQNMNSTENTYNVLMPETLFDLRALTTNDNPTLYFWTRYHLGRYDYAEVQVASENTSYSATNGLGVHNTFDYQRVTGWNNWQTLWTRGSTSGDVRVDTWFRVAVDLRSFAGQRIKVRFVYNVLNTDTERDGWYVDDVILEQRSTFALPLPFRDNARSLGNWIVEGTWGLAPDQWRGSGGGPADIGTEFWTGVYYDCERRFWNLGGLGQGLYPDDTDPCSSTTEVNRLLYIGTYNDSNHTNNVERPYDSRWDIQEFALEIDHDFRSTGRPIGGQLDNTWFDTFAGRWKRPITISAPSDITFIAITDDGMRMKYTGPGAPNGWNIFNQWAMQGRTVYIRTISFNPGSYNLTLEWFERGGDATIILSAGVNNFSFADSPKAGSSPSFPVINSVRYGNSSLILRSPINLTGTTLPVIQYWTRFKMGGGTGRFEVSNNGGFDWIVSGLGTNNNGFICPPDPPRPANLRSADGTTLDMGTCDPLAVNQFWPIDNNNREDLTVWQLRTHNLTSYRPGGANAGTSNGLINLRFNLQTTDWVDDGWYITDIEINP